MLHHIFDNPHFEGNFGNDGIKHQKSAGSKGIISKFLSIAWRPAFSSFMIAAALSVSGCSGVMVNGKFVPTGSPEASYMFYGHTFDIVPTLGSTDRIVIRGGTKSIDTKLSKVRIVAQKVIQGESIVVIAGTKYSGDYAPTWEIVSTRQDGMSIYRIPLAPTGVSSDPYSFTYNEDGLEIRDISAEGGNSQLGGGVFYRAGKFYSLADYYRHKAALERRAASSSYHQRAQHTSYRKTDRVRPTRLGSSSNAPSNQGFVDDVSRVEGKGVNNTSQSTGQINLQD
ncbi:hypothetical protein [Acetobacter pasteurianus]|uniref:hypothetical protein n=1 Tax=Acetobacter pasteurianus TaxID=438 RepID=UPI002493B82A|nr:hypothetical protein [Acetobacter pasteurianus]